MRPARAQAPRMAPSDLGGAADSIVNRLLTAALVCSTVITAGPREAEEKRIGRAAASFVQRRDGCRGRRDRLLDRRRLAADRRARGPAALVPILFVPSMNWGDEVFQTVEPAHRLVYGYGLMTWEFQLGMRSWLLPGTIAGLIELGRMVGDGPEYYLAAIAIGLGILAAAPVVCGFPVVPALVWPGRRLCRRRGDRGGSGAGLFRGAGAQRSRRRAPAGHRALSGRARLSGSTTAAGCSRPAWCSAWCRCCGCSSRRRPRWSRSGRGCAIGADGCPR